MPARAWKYRYFEDEAAIFLEKYLAPILFEEEINVITAELYDIFINSLNGQEWAKLFCEGDANATVTS